MLDTAPQGGPLDAPRAFAAALDLFKLGRSDAAEEAALALIGHHPRHAGALHLLGIIDLQHGRAESALDRLRRSVAEEPRNADAHSSLGMALAALDRTDEAIAELEQAIALKPAHAEAHNNLGNMLRRQGKLEPAIDVYRKAVALKPEFVDALVNLAGALALSGDKAGATAAARQIASLRPTDGLARVRLGRALAAAGDLDAAIAAFREAIALEPGLAEAHVNLATALAEQHRHEEALEVARHALSLDRDNPRALCVFGVALGVRGDTGEALASFRRAIALQPDLAEAHANLGEALRRNKEPEEAVAAYRQALRLDPKLGATYTNLGHALRELGRNVEAFEAYRRAVAIEPDRAGHHGNLAIALLLDGHLAQGFEEYEWRWKTPELAPRAFAQPAWAGEALGDRVLLVHAEQGYGDAIQFCRFAPMAAAQGKVVLEVPRGLERLLSSLPGAGKIVTWGDDLPPFDTYCAVMSLPRIFGTTLETLPNTVPYLAAEPKDVAAWRQRMRGLAGLKVGIAWASNPDPDQTKEGAADRQQKSMRLAQLAPLAAVPGVSFVSLQMGEAAAEAPPPGLVIQDWTGDIHDFAETAAAIEALDLVISIDTSVAHLAGALGKPVWLLNRFNTDWRWMRGRDDSPWYPTMRIFRQPKTDDWDAVVREVAGALRTWRGDRAEKRKPARTGKARKARPVPAAKPQTGAAPEARAAVAPVPPSEATREGPGTEIVQSPDAPRWPVIFAWGLASSFGWGVYGLNLALNLADDAELLPICASAPADGDVTLDALRRTRLDPVLKNSRTFDAWLAGYHDCTVKTSCPVLHGLGNGLAAPKLARNIELRGSTEIGMFFIENTAIDDGVRARARRHSLMVAGSTWNQRLVEAEVRGVPVALVRQGIDLSVFHPGPKTGMFKDRFVVFSGGKLEFRKGQDLVMLAFRAFRERHPEALLVTAWHSPWDGLARQLTVNPRVAPVPFKGASIDVTGWAAANGLPAESVVDLGPVPNFQLPPILRECDVALFPNRAEGGTNLVAMECMACGIPCIVSANTGHLDLIAGESCWPLQRQGPVAATPPYAGTEGWGESNVEEMVEALETLWRQRARAARIGRAGARMMAGWGWPEQIAKLKRVLIPHLAETLESEENARKIVLEPCDFRAAPAPAQREAGGAMPDAPPATPATSSEPDLQQLFDSARERQGAGDTAAAMQLYGKVLARHPAVPDALNNIAVMLKAEKRLPAAIAYLRRALLYAPGAAGLHSNLGNMLWMAHRHDEAMAAFRRALELDAKRPEIHHNLGLLQFSLGDFGASVASFDRALALVPGNHLVEWDRALAILANGDYARGFAAYEVRLDLDDPSMPFDRRLRTVRSMKLPLWNGEDLAGRTIYVYTEQGLGDTLQFVRFLPFLARRGARIILDCPADFLRLFRSLPEIAELRQEGGPPPKADFHLPLCSLPHRLGTTLADLPAEVPYLKVGAAQRTLMRLPGTKLAAGVVWAGRPEPNKDRTIALEDCLELCDLPGLSLYSLQKGPRAADITALGASALIGDLDPFIADFADTAELMMQLDLVITIDTAVAHLAGALGRPTFVLLPFTADWRWMSGRKDSPWYPTVRLFRQKTPGDWKGVIADVREALRLMTG